MPQKKKNKKSTAIPYCYVLLNAAFQIDAIPLTIHMATLDKEIAKTSKKIIEKTYPMNCVKIVKVDFLNK